MIQFTESSMTDTNDRYRAPALDKGLDILELLAGIEGGLTQAEIAKALGRSPNEFYRMLERLARRPRRAAARPRLGADGGRQRLGRAAAAGDCPRRRPPWRELRAA